MASAKRKQHNLKVLRRFREDIWGKVGLSKKESRILNYFYLIYKNNYKYRDILQKRRFFIKRKKLIFKYSDDNDDKELLMRRRSLKSIDYVNKLKLRRFYGNINEKHFKRMFKNSKVSTNVLSKSFAYLLESRLDVILYRANFFDSIFSARQYINHRKVYVNGLVMDRPGYSLTLDDIVTLENPELLYENLRRKLLKGEILANYPKYLEVNYKLGSVMLISLPVNEEVPYPFFININYMVYNYLK